MEYTHADANLSEKAIVMQIGYESIWFAHASYTYKSMFNVLCIYVHKFG